MVIQSFLDDDCLFYAGAVAYQIFFAFIPLLALIVGILAFVYGPDRAQREIVQMIREIYPSATAQEVRIARELVQGRALSLGLGAVGTVLSAAAIHGSLDLALAAALGKEGRRTFVRRNAAAAAFIAAVALLAVVSFGLSYGVAALSGALAEAGFGTFTRAAFAAAFRGVSQHVAGRLICVVVCRIAAQARSDTRKPGANTFRPLRTRHGNHAPAPADRR